LIDSRSGQSVVQPKELFTCSNPTAGRYVRITTTSINTSYTAIGELRFNPSINS